MLKAEPGRYTLSQALTWAQRRDLIARNVAALTNLPTSNTLPRTGQSFSVAQARQFLAAAEDTELGAMWIVMLFLGIRPGEASGLSWHDIDSHATIHIWHVRMLLAVLVAPIVTEPPTLQCAVRADFLTDREQLGALHSSAA